MGHQHDEDFKREAVRLALSSSLPRKRVAADLGIGFSTLGKWISIYRTEERINSATDEGELDEVYETERHLFYVACTRARDKLNVTSINPASEFFEDLLD